MISKRELECWQDLLTYAVNNRESTCALFIDTLKDISELYERIPNSTKALITLNLSTNTLYFDNGSRILIRKAESVTLEKLKGIKIDVAAGYELLDNKSRKELLIIRRIIIKEND